MIHPLSNQVKLAILMLQFKSLYGLFKPISIVFLRLFYPFFIFYLPSETI